MSLFELNYPPHIIQEQKIQNKIHTIISKMKSSTFLCCCAILLIQLSFAFQETNTSCTNDCCKSLPSRGPMTYYFYQNTGRFIGGSGDYAIDTHGYSGQGAGYLNPDYQCVQDIGPLPATTYKLTYCKNTMHNPPVQRPCSFYLEPQKPSEMCGLDDFFIHGCQCCTTKDDTQPPVNGCSAGCIVINYQNRKKIRVGDIIIVRQYEPKSYQVANE